jgi:hypothetical protein
MDIIGSNLSKIQVHLIESAGTTPITINTHAGMTRSAVVPSKLEGSAFNS